jgi:hypothetical protein
MKIKNKRSLGIVLIVLGLLFATGYTILSLPVFGGKIAGMRLKRIQKNPQYQDGGFVNVEPQTPFEISEIGSFLSESFFYDEIRTPPSMVPVLTVDPLSIEPLLPNNLKAVDRQIIWIKSSDYMAA